MKLELIQGDCMDVMRDIEDNYFDLAVVDPPYGIRADYERHRQHGNNGFKEYGELKEWDRDRPPKEYFKYLFRISKNQIIWGGNYMVEHITPSMGWIVWDKGQRNFSLSDAELAWSSFNKALRVFDLSRGGALASDTTRIHPTQKPVKLYDWIYHNYAQEGQKILDTHLGSGSNAIAAHYAKMGSFTGIELDPDYFKAAQARIKECTRQQELF